MSSKRQLKLKEYGISPKRYKELCGFCEQYPEWKKMLAEMTVISAVTYSDEPKSPNIGTSDTTGKLATRRIELSERCQMIEDAAKGAVRDGNQEMINGIIKSVCYEVPFYKLGIPYSPSTFYEYRRYFFYLLNQKKRKI